MKGGDGKTQMTREIPVEIKLFKETDNDINEM